MASLTDIRDAVAKNCGSTAVGASFAPVSEEFDGSVVWEGNVHVFRLEDHPTAEECYAFEHEGRIAVILREPPIDTPQDAVRAAIVAAHREREK